MLRPRLVVSLLLHNDGLVKTKRFDAPNYVGDPINAVRIFNEKRVDELTLFDISATTQNKQPNYKLIEDVAAECRMPLCYGGGIQDIDQALRIFDLGVEKVSMSSAAVKRPRLLEDISRCVGSQSVVLVLDIKKRRLGKRFDVWTRSGTNNTRLDPLVLASKARTWGVGELVLNFVDRDGMMSGYDLSFVAAVRAVTTLPLTILGGAGSLSDISELIRAHGVVGAGAGSLFVYKGPYRAVLINYPNAADKARLVVDAQREFSDASNREHHGLLASG